MNQELEDQLAEMRGRLEWQRGQHSMRLENGRFNLDAWRAINEMRLRFIDKQMDVERHVVDMASKWIDVANKRIAGRNFIAAMKRLKQTRKSVDDELNGQIRAIKASERLYQGQAMKTIHRVSTWRRFGGLTLRSRIIFPATSGPSTFWKAKQKNIWVPHETTTRSMTMFQLADYCRNKRLIVDPISDAFEFIIKAFDEMLQRQREIRDQLILDLKATQDRIDTLNKEQASKAGLV